MNLKRSFIFNILFMLGVNFIVKPIWVFGIDRTVQNDLGSNEYGLYFAIFNFTYLFQILLDFGLQNYNQTEISKDRLNFPRMFANTVFAKIILIIIYILVSTLVAHFLGYTKYKFFYWILLNQILLSFNILLRTNVSAHQLFIRDAFLSVIDKILMIIGALFMLIPAIQILDLSIMNFVKVQTLALLITSAVCILFNLKLSPHLVWKIDLSIIKKVILESIPFATIYFLMSVSNRIDTVMIEQILGNQGATQAGIYAQSYRIIESINNMGYVIAGILLPLFAYRIGQKESVHQVLKHAYSLMLTIIIPIVIGGVFFANDIMETLYAGHTTVQSSQVFMVLTFNFISIGMLYVFGTLLTANKNFSLMIPALLVTTILNIITNYLLIPRLGALGAAITTFGTQLSVLVIYVIACFKIFRLPFSVQILLSSIAFATVISVLAYLLSLSSIFWLFALMIIGIASIIVSFLFKIVTVETLKLKF
ncbi:MAG: oligosaccharide flippase family protein [Chitinophagales bacterium]|nr:oligosaccharide flippase family protein [Chitinophagales bacterium]